MRRIVTISYTGLDASGGVPKFNRDLHSAFADRECLHFSWTDHPWHPEIDARGETEWGRARVLNEYLVQSRKVTTDDVVIADGFWAAGLEHLPLAVSHSHGIWSHLTLDDVKAGKASDMPYHHAAQVAFRQRWTALRKHITAVSAFIANQMELQWGFKVDRVINNGVDTDVYRPDGRRPKTWLNDPLIIHGVNDRGNANKGWDHIEFLKRELLGYHVLSLDEAHSLIESREGTSWTKAEVLALADVVVHPSGFEGNSMFVAESLACGVPLVGYDVGYLWGVQNECGAVIDRTQRSPEFTLSAVSSLIANSGFMTRLAGLDGLCRALALRDLSLDRFNSEWRNYVKEIEG